MHPAVPDGVQNDGVYSGGTSSIAKPEDKSEQYCPAPRICPEKCTCSGGLVDCSNKDMDRVPFNIPEEATELRLHTNKITQIPDYAFAKLGKLVKLDICNNHIRELSPNAFSGLVNVRQLNIYSNQIEDLPVEVFQNLPELNILLLNANRINCLRKGTFENLNNLRLLSLFLNNIRAIENGTLDILRSTTLHLGSNPLICDCNLRWITMISTKESSGARCDFPARVKDLEIRNLKPDDFVCEGGERERTANAGSCFIDLPCPDNCQCDGEGKVECVNQDLTSIPPNLPRYTSELDLSGNKISKILADGSFQNLPNLRTLDLSNNRIGKIETGSFDGATNLHSLDLKQNELSHIEKGVFDPLKNLTFLELRENYFKCVKNSTFSGLRKLTHLSLAENMIKTIEINTFEDLPLYTLNLLGNHLICNCYMGWFNTWLNNKNGLVHGNPRCQQPSNLKDLPIADLNNNDLSCSDDEQNGCTQDSTCPEFCTCDKNFVQCREVSVTVPQNIPLETTHLAINSALIRVFNPLDFEYLPNLEVLDLSRNFIGSIIPPPNNRNFKGLRRLKKLNLGYNYIKCIQQDSFTMLWELEELILSSNALSQIFDSTFQNMTHIKKLDISGNPIYCDCNLKWLAIQKWSEGLEIDGKCSEPERTKGLAISDIHRKDFTCQENEPPLYVNGKCDPCVLKPCNGGTCRLTEGNDDFICDCQENYEGRFCEKTIDYCYEKPCQNGAVCHSDSDSNKFTCDCPKGFAGTMCEQNIDDCENHECKHDSKCIDGLNSYTCDCGVGYKGEFCETDIDICEISNNPCMNSGVCVDLGSDYQCHCQQGFKGKNCEQKIDLCLTKIGSPVCKNGALCKSENFDQVVCVCKDGFSGSRCERLDEKPETSTVRINPMTVSTKNSNTNYGSNCDSETCTEKQGSCQSLNGQEFCQCFDGFEGKKCEHIKTITFEDKFSSVKTKIPWPDVKNFTFVGTFADEAGLIFSTDLKNVYSYCTECFLIVYIKRKQVKVSIKQLNEGKPLKVTSAEIITPGTSKFSVVLSQRFITIIDLTSGAMETEVIPSTAQAPKVSSTSEVVVFGYNANLPKKASNPPLTENAKEIGCLEMFQVNNEVVYFDAESEKNGIGTGFCKFQKEIQEDVLMDDPKTAVARICGQQKMQYLHYNDCPSTRKYKYVSRDDCPPTCTNLVPNNVDGSLETDGQTQCCRFSRYRDYTVRYRCEKKPAVVVKTEVAKKCECKPCPA